MKKIRITVTCHRCGKTTEKTPSQVHEFNYCSRECAQAEHGQKITGPRHPQWKGGALNSRGRGWSMIRLEVIARQGHKCGGCGMTEDEHKTKYKKSFSVHHKSPYRLDQNNHPDNLIALCPTCHGIEESATHKKLSPDDWNKIREITAEKRALGIDIRESTHWCTPCPQCGTPKDRRAGLCKKCRIKSNKIAKKVHRCNICGKPKANAANRTCWNCRTFDGLPRIVVRKNCVQCGTQFKPKKPEQKYCKKQCYFDAIKKK
jgi:5-methylcytosine-specific restriction endonuclease McrA